MYDLFKNAKHSASAQQKIQELIHENFVDGHLGLPEMFWVVRLPEPQAFDKDSKDSLQKLFREVRRLPGRGSLGDGRGDHQRGRGLTHLYVSISALEAGFTAAQAQPLTLFSSSLAS